MSAGSEAAARQAERVAEIIRERGKTHGDAIVQHQKLAALWSGYIGVEVSAAQAMYMLLLLKVSRISAGGIAAEHVEDIAGYACLIMGERQQAADTVRAMKAQSVEGQTEHDETRPVRRGL